MHKFLSQEKNKIVVQLLRVYMRDASMHEDNITFAEITDMYMHEFVTYVFYLLNKLGSRSRHVYSLSFYRRWMMCPMAGIIINFCHVQRFF